MKVKDLSGKEHIWSPYKSLGNKRLNVSKIHLDALNFLRTIYPAAQLLEEVYIPGEDLYIDIYIPSLKTAVECQGEQHGKYNKFFHGPTSKGFNRSLDRDRRKKEWCELNGIRTVYFYPDESEEQWKSKMLP